MYSTTKQKLNNLFKSKHKCKYDKNTQKEYTETSSGDWIIYQIYWCKCGNYILTKKCGTIELNDIPEWVQKSKTNNEAKRRVI
jgi:hypothetical protein